MRSKIILVNGGILLVLSLLTFFLLRTSVATVVANPAEQRKQLERTLRSANAQLSLDALRSERWLARRSDDAEVRGVFAKGTLAARQDAATAQANRLRDEAVAASDFSRMAPSIVLFVDADGVGIGRNGSELMRGDQVAKAYPALAQTIKAGTTGSDLWVSATRDEQLFVSYSAVLGEGGEPLGAVAMGMPLNDERLTRTSELTSGNSLALIFGEAGPAAAGGPKQTGFAAPQVTAAVKGARSGSLTHAVGETGGMLYGAAALGGYAATSAVLVAAVPASLVPSVDGLLWPVFAVGALGFFLVIVGAIVLGNYISRPISEIEEGLLLVINGQRDLRFELEHAELGGLTSRINGLLNTLLDVEESQDS